MEDPSSNTMLSERPGVPPLASHALSLEVSRENLDETLETASLGGCLA